MRVITQREIIKGVPARWRRQYEPFEHTSPMPFWAHNSKSREQIAKELDALDVETATAEQVNKIIGNASWTRLRCDQCKSDVLAIVRVGEDPDYESHTACLCEPCVRLALGVFSAQTPEPKKEPLARIRAIKDEIIRLLCVNALEHYRATLCHGPESIAKRFHDLTHPQPGDLVMEISTFYRHDVPHHERIGTLVSIGGPLENQVWRIKLDFDGGRILSWENAAFIKVRREGKF